MRFIVLLYLFLIFCLPCAYKKAQAQEKCKRPNWKIIYNKELDCKMRFNHFILYKTSIEKPEIEKNKGFCLVKQGSWFVDSLVGKIMVYHPQDINIDHVLPYSYIVKQVGCSQARQFFNWRYNLKITEALYNKTKSDKICENKDICKQQKRICKAMEEEFKIKLNCDKLGS